MALNVVLEIRTTRVRLANVDPEEDEFDFEEEDWDQYIPMKILMWL
jgi:hypothetical protein